MNMNATLPRATFGGQDQTAMSGKLPKPFPRTMGPNCEKYLREVIEDGLVPTMTRRFEQTFAEIYGVKHCIATPGCTPALAVLAAVLDFEPGDEIIVSPVTDYGSLLGIINENYIPIFPDTEPGTINFSAETIEPAISDRTRAILAVHKTGLICDMDEINQLARKHNLIVYEDACQAVFGKYKGKLAGTLSKAAGFSFDAEKTMGSDVGGCIITNDDELAERARFIGNSRGARQFPSFGRKHIEKGYAYRMPQCTAAVTLAQLEIIGPNVAQRDKMARYLSSLLDKIPGITSLPIPDYVDVYSCWMIGFSINPEMFSCSTEKFAQQLDAAGIPGAGMGTYYLMPEAITFLNEKAQKEVYPYSQPPASRTYEYNEKTCPTAHAFLQNFIRWSTFCEKYTEEHCELAADIVRTVVERNKR